MGSGHQAARRAYVMERSGVMLDLDAVSSIGRPVPYGQADDPPYRWFGFEVTFWGGGRMGVRTGIRLDDYFDLVDAWHGRRAAMPIRKLPPSYTDAGMLLRGAGRDLDYGGTLVPMDFVVWVSAYNTRSDGSGQFWVLTRYGDAIDLRDHRASPEHHAEFIGHWNTSLRQGGERRIEIAGHHYILDTIAGISMHGAARDEGFRHSGSAEVQDTYGAFRHTFLHAHDGAWKEKDAALKALVTAWHDHLNGEC